MIIPSFSFMAFYVNVLKFKQNLHQKINFETLIFYYERESVHFREVVKEKKYTVFNVFESLSRHICLGSMHGGVG